ncbi:MAG: hypothetical protein ABH919_02685 [bacterium]
MPHFSGKKIAKKHSTVIEMAELLVRTTLELTIVSKIVIGEIVPVRNGPKRMKITIIPAGLKIMVRGINARQQLFIYTGRPELVQIKLEQVWQKNN